MRIQSVSSATILNIESWKYLLLETRTLLRHVLFYYHDSSMYMRVWTPLLKTRIKNKYMKKTSEGRNESWYFDDSEKIEL